MNSFWTVFWGKPWRGGTPNPTLHDVSEILLDGNLDLILSSILSLIYSQAKKKKSKLPRMSFLLLQLKLALQCQPWLVLAHGHFHALYLDPPGTVWNPEISLSTKHVILRSVELKLASGQWRLKSRPWKQRTTVNILTLFLNAVCRRLLSWKLLLEAAPRRKSWLKAGVFPRCVALVVLWSQTPKCTG